MLRFSKFEQLKKNSYMFNDFGNIQVAGLPAHLRQFVVSQNYEDYTAVDHAVWRYVMRKNVDYLSKVACLFVPLGI